MYFFIRPRSFISVENNLIGMLIDEQIEGFGHRQTVPFVPPQFENTLHHIKYYPEIIKKLSVSNFNDHLHNFDDQLNEGSIKTSPAVSFAGFTQNIYPIWPTRRDQEQKQDR